MQNTFSGAEDNRVEMSLREHLLAAQAGQALPPSPATHTMHAGPTASPHDQRIDPAIAGAAYHPHMSGHDLGDSGGESHGAEGRKGRRELSTSKRAAQNRAAQRAFRQRKEEYIKSLKDQVEDYKKLADDYKAIQAENYQLREYVINLQQRLLESQGNYPEPPSNIDLSRPRPGLEPVIHQSSALDPGISASAVNQLQAATAQAGQEPPPSPFKSANQDGQSPRSLSASSSASYNGPLYYEQQGRAYSVPQWYSNGTALPPMPDDTVPKNEQRDLNNT